MNEILDRMNSMSEHVPTVYDCDGCKYNTSLIKDEHCRGCRMLNGSSWMYRQKPTNFEPFETTFTTQISGEET